MAAGRRRIPSNYVAEWFGHVVWPEQDVDSTSGAVLDQTSERCPFLSNATATDMSCAKQSKEDNLPIRTGLCTVSSPSTGVRENWLACPWRVFDESFTLITEAIRRLYRIGRDEPILAFPVTRFGSPEAQSAVRALDRGRATAPRVFAFSSNPHALGGEIEIPETNRSPGSKVDVSIFEVLGTRDDSPMLGRAGLFEIQAGDFHGSPLHAIRQLRRLGPPSSAAPYHDNIIANAAALGDGVQGPNKANIFKRTIYQMILKIQMAKDERCAGFAAVLPEPVWRSWSCHLGAPELIPDEHDPDVWHLRAPGAGYAGTLVEAEPAWILVFRIDRESDQSPKPLEIVKRIATDSRALLHYAFDAAPEAAIAEGAMEAFEATFRERLVAGGPATRARRRPSPTPR